MLPVMVCAEGFLLSHTSEVLDIPDQDAVDAFLPESRRPTTGCSTRTGRAAFSALPEPNDYAAFQRNVAEAHGRGPGPDRDGRRRSSRRTSGGARSAHSRSPATRTRGGRSSRSGRSASRRWSSSTTTATCSSSASTPTGRSRRPALSAALAGVSYVTVVDRAAAFGSFGPLGSDVRSLDLRDVKAGDERRLRARRDGGDARDAALGAGTDAVGRRGPGIAPVYVPEGV